MQFYIFIKADLVYILRLFYTHITIIRKNKLIFL